MKINIFVDKMIKCLTKNQIKQEILYLSIHLIKSYRNKVIKEDSPPGRMFFL